MVAETIVFPDGVLTAVTILRAGLTTKGDTASVHREVPAVRPSRWVQVVLTGGDRHTLVSDAKQVTVSAWAGRFDQAAALAELCRGILGAAAGSVVGGVPVYRVDEIGSPYDNPDPVTGSQRVTFSVRLHVRGVAV